MSVRFRHGLIVRFAPIRGVTPHHALASRIYLPGVLSTFDVVETSLHNEYDTLSGGHFSQPAMGDAKARQFRTTTLDTLTMDWDPVWFAVTGQDPVELRRAIAEILRARKPVHLLAWLTPNGPSEPELDMYCTLRQQTVSLRGGEKDTRYVRVDVSEWRDPTVQRRTSAGHSRKRGANLPTTKAITATDTLESLSREFYGSFAYWRDIRDANSVPVRFGQKTPLVSMPGRWKVGLKVKIPKLSHYTSKVVWKGKGVPANWASA